MVADWPARIPAARMRQLGADDETEKLDAAKFELIRAVRNLRANYQIAPSRALDVVVTPADSSAQAFLERDEASFKALLNAGAVTFGDRPEGPCGVAVSSLGNVFVPLARIIDVAAEVARLRKQEDEAVKYIAVIDRRWWRPSVRSAPRPKRSSRGSAARSTPSNSRQKRPVHGGAAIVWLRRRRPPFIRSV